MRRTSRFLLTIMVAAVFAATAAAQSKKQQEKADASVRTLQGTVYDAADAPVVGAVVQLKDLRTLQIRSFITQEQGGYHFSGLKVDADYQVKADFNGATSDTKTVSVFDNRKAPTVNLKLAEKK